MSLLKITPSLINSLDYAVDVNELDGFRETLERLPKPTTEAQQRGILFEGNVYGASLGQFTPDDSDSEQAAAKLGKKLQGAAYQVRGSKHLKVNGQELLLVGVADFIRAGICYDVKTTAKYEYGKYFSSAQHPAYFALFDGLKRFDYLVFDGHQLYTETYRKGDFQPIETHIARFLDTLDGLKLFGDYEKYWRVQE